MSVVSALHARCMQAGATGFSILNYGLPWGTLGICLDARFRRHALRRRRTRNGGREYDLHDQLHRTAV